MLNLQQSDFQSCLNTIFEVYPQGRNGALSMELLEVSETRSQPAGSFSLLFRGRSENALEFGTHVVNHFRLGEFSLLIGPIFPGMFGGVCYQAIFLPFKQNAQPWTPLSPWGMPARAYHA